MEDIKLQPTFTSDDAVAISREHFGIVGEAVVLPSERDQNFKIASQDGAFVLKIANPSTHSDLVELENAALQIAVAIASFESPRLIKTLANAPIVMIRDPAGRDCCVRMISFLNGKTLASLTALPERSCFEFGVALADLNLGLQHLNQNVAAQRKLKWDLKNGSSIVRASIENEASFTEDQRRTLRCFLQIYDEISNRIDELPHAVIHNDANDHNVLIDESDELSDQTRVGLIDFGDMMFTTQINELAIAGAYLLLRADGQIRVAEMAAGYHTHRPLSENELSVLFPLMMMRLCQSVCIAAEQRRECPENQYLSVTETPAWDALQRLQGVSAAAQHEMFSKACSGSQVEPGSGQESTGEMVEAGSATPAKSGTAKFVNAIHRERSLWIAPSLSLSYQSPLHIVRGRGQYLYDAADVTYLDCVNNVCHVGHCHPQVVAAAQRQMGSLNTNTRYLHANLIKYAKRLTAKLPESLDVCFFVNSGSEANDLALRLAKAKTRGTETVVIDHAYHGHTSALIDLSPYKFDSPGGAGKPQHVHVVPMPDLYRGAFSLEQYPDAAARYASAAVDVVRSAASEGKQVNAFFAESLLGCGGQVPLPNGYLKAIYKSVRDAGGVCVADEVQVGFGRVGSHFWGFELQGVVPDIVTMGKPIGNGHPLAAVVTTREIADAFNNGMEYFNTFGGNPVSCAVGLAVLDVIENEEMQQHAWQVGQQLMASLNELKAKHHCVGDVRGSGLFIGIEIVQQGTKEPDAQLAAGLVERMKTQRILLSTDGPDHNVIKFKPPMVFSAGDADRLVMALTKALRLA